MTNNYNPKSSENGIEYKFATKQNITSTEFLGKFSLLVMTGLTIGSVPLWWGLSLYLIFYSAIAIIFIRCDMFYLNPIVTLLGYEIYKCECFVKEEKKNVYFIVKGIDLNNKEAIKKLADSLTQDNVPTIEIEKSLIDGYKNISYETST